MVLGLGSIGSMYVGRLGSTWGISFVEGTEYLKKSPRLSVSSVSSVLKHLKQKVPRSFCFNCFKSVETLEFLK